MKPPRLFPLSAAFLLLVGNAIAHDLAGGGSGHRLHHLSASPPREIAPGWFAATANPVATRSTSRFGAPPSAAPPPALAAVFEPFAPRVKVRWNDTTLFVETSGLPEHGLMRGITNWQQQVPVPQDYLGANAWSLPLHPVPAKEPLSIKGRFLRGAIALAANGVPIFNPQNNRGEISADIGELDEWGGHCGRADDYHYHAAPLHLQEKLGPNRPIAVALDGYQIFGLTEPDGSAPSRLDSFNGHTTNALGYHYHASTSYPFVNGGFHGEVSEVGGQADPQPGAQPARGAGPPLRGAKITGFETTGKDAWKLSYEVGGEKRAIVYAVNSGNTLTFEYQNGQAGTSRETYQRRSVGAGPGGGNGGEGQRRSRGENPARPGDGSVPVSPKSPTASGFHLTSPVVAEGGELPAEFTGDGVGHSPPLAWSGAPAGTKSFAVLMDHIPGPGDVKWYWTVYQIPAGTTSLPANSTAIGKIGTGFKGRIGYEPPHSQGPGRKIYTIRLYALSAEPKVTVPPGAVNRDVLLAALRDITLASAELNVTCTRSENTTAAAGRPNTQPSGNQGENNSPMTRPRRPEVDALDLNQDGVIDAAELNQASASLRKLDLDGDGKLGPDEIRPGRRDDIPATASGTSAFPPAAGPRGNPAGGNLVKATMADTIRAEVYADNWFALYVNGRLTVVDPIAFLPHNVVSVDLLPEYPMTLAVIAHDNADPQTGLEYGNHIGDGGLILKFADGTVTDASWKVKVLERGPLNSDIANPKVENFQRPANWFATDFDDSSWDNATVFTEDQVKPRESFYQHDFTGAKFIWSKDIGLDNTVLFRKRVERPGAVRRWTAQPAGPLPAP